MSSRPSSRPSSPGGGVSSRLRRAVDADPTPPQSGSSNSSEKGPGWIPQKVKDRLSFAMTPKTMRFLQLAGSVLIIHGIAAVCTEALFTRPGFRFGWFYTTVECVVYGFLVPTEVWLGLKEQFYPKEVFFREIRVGTREAWDSTLGRVVKLAWLSKKDPPGALSPTSSNRPNIFSSRYGPRPQFLFRDACLCGLVWAISHGCGAAAYIHISVSFGAMVKAAKIPVILSLGALMHRNYSPSLWEGAGVGIFYVGLVLFGLGEKYESPRYNLIGVALMAINVAMGSYSANLQQKVLHGSIQHRFSGMEDDGAKSRSMELRQISPKSIKSANSGISVGTAGTTETTRQERDSQRHLSIALLMTCQYTCAAIFLLSYIILSGELYEAIAWFLTAGESSDGSIKEEFYRTGLGMRAPSSGKHSFVDPFSEPLLFVSTFLSPSHLMALPSRNLGFVRFLMENFRPHYWGILATFGDDFLTYYGMYWIYGLIQEFDATRSNAVCSVRKSVTFVASYFLFPKPFGKFHVWGVALSFLGFGVLHWGAERRKRFEKAKRLKGE